jgi:hypothetical protein
MHLVGYLYEDYHDARTLEHKVPPKRRHSPTTLQAVASHTTVIAIVTAVKDATLTRGSSAVLLRLY